MRFSALLELGNRRRSHFFVHPGPLEAPPEADVRSARDDSAWQRHIVLESQARLSEAMVTLNLSGYLDPFPKVTVQVVNLGGAIPFLLERMDRVAREQPDAGPVPSGRISRCYFDTASFGPRAIEMAVACLGADRLLLGTGCPIFDTARTLRSLAESRIDAEVREQIRLRNARENVSRPT